MGSSGRSSAAASTVEDGAVGKGGIINITTGSLSIANGAVLSASTRGQGDGGNITFNANSLEAVNGGQVVTTNYSSNKAGNITLNVTDSVILSGSDATYNARFADFGEARVNEAGSASGLFANTSENSTGQGGDLRIETGQLTVRDGAQVTVSSEGSGNAGNIEVRAASLRLNERGKLTAQSASGQGGNITLRAQDLLLLRNQSQISTSSGSTGAGGDGGDITINDTRFIVAVPSEDSDITANAFEGNGGNIQITVQGVFGLERRSVLTPLSDITAFSQQNPELNGVVEINTPNVDPSQGLVELPVILIDTEVVQACTPGGSKQQSEFIITGRGGLPPNPGDALSTDAVQVDLVTLKPEVEQPSTPAVSTSPTSPTPARIVEAQGWVMDANGNVVLIANAPTVTPHSSWQKTTDCRAFNQQSGLY